jgi:hypothetical protein
MADAHTYTCPHCEKGFRSQAAPNGGEIECPWCQMTSRPERAYLETPQAHATGAAVASREKRKGGVRAALDAAVATDRPVKGKTMFFGLLPGMDEIETRSSKCLLARISLAAAAFSLVAAVLCVCVAVYAAIMARRGRGEVHGNPSPYWHRHFHGERSALVWLRPALLAHRQDRRAHRAHLSAHVEARRPRQLIPLRPFPICPR